MRGFPTLSKGNHGILVDICLSENIAAALSRFEGLQAVHLRDVYTDAPKTPDVQFLADAGDAGWSVFTQNFAMMRVPLEMQAIRDHGTKVFTLTTARLNDPGKGLMFGRHLVSIRRRMRKPGPCFWRLYEERKGLPHSVKPRLAECRRQVTDMPR